VEEGGEKFWMIGKERQLTREIERFNLQKRREEDGHVVEDGEAFERTTFLVVFKLTIEKWTHFKWIA
jgi:hypothetical protein